jgi:hypothetical protein
LIACGTTHSSRDQSGFFLTCDKVVDASETRPGTYTIQVSYYLVLGF